MKSDIYAILLELENVKNLLKLITEGCQEQNVSAVTYREIASALSPVFDKICEIHQDLNEYYTNLKGL